MDAVELNTLKLLFLSGKHAEIIQSAEDAIRRHPEALEGYYYAGLSCVCAGDTARGFGYLSQVLERFQKDPASTLTDRSRALLVGYTALQFSQLTDGYEFRALAHAYGAVYARVASTIGNKYQDADLQNTASSLLVRHKPWRKTLADGRVVTGTYFVPDSPFVLQVEPTNQCNLRCTMCPYEAMTRKKGYLDLSLWKQILLSWSNRIKEIVLTHYLSEAVIRIQRPHGVKLFFMGDPLLHPQFEKLIAQAREPATKCPVYIETNGFLLKDASVRTRLLAAVPSVIGVSIDGVSEESYNSVRKGSSWKAVEGAIRDLSRQRKEMGLEKVIKIGIATIIPQDTPENKARTRKFLEPVCSYVDYVNYMPLDRQFKGSFFNPAGEIFGYEHRVPAPVSENYPVCIEPLEKLNILWDGSVIPCCNDINGAHILGHASAGIDTVWRSERTRQLHDAILRQKLESFPLCARCYGGATAPVSSVTRESV